MDISGAAHGVDQDPHVPWFWTGMRGMGTAKRVTSLAEVDLSQPVVIEVPS
jgi:hypothetical protein